MNQETFEQEIFDKARVNKASALFSTVADMRTQLLARSKIKLADKVDVLDVVALALLAGGGQMSYRDVDTVNYLNPHLLDQLISLNTTLNQIQSQLAQARKIDLGKFREYLQF